ncbi:MAG: GDSL-type esterase/lipase family protein [Myxococcota bacterium]
MKKLAARLALLSVSLLISLAAAEGIYRWSQQQDDAPDGDDDDWRQRYIRLNETLYRRSNAELIYEPVPGATVPMEYGQASFNEGAMRMDHEVAVTPTERRVAVLGDSIVWSEFLAAHDALPQRLDQALGEGWEVLNFGVTGYDTAQEAAWYERAVRRYRPEIAVLVWCMNDVMIMSGPFERVANPEERARKDAQEALIQRVAPVRRETIDGVHKDREAEATLRLLARLEAILDRRRFDANYIDEYLVMFDQEESRARVEAALRRLGHALEEDGVQGVFVISPVLESWEDYHWTAMHEWLEEEASEAGFSVVDLFTQWKGSEDPESMRVSGDNLHYDGSGARVFARTVADALRALPRNE